MCSVQHHLDDLSDPIFEIVKHAVYLLASAMTLVVSLSMGPMYLCHAWKR
jgi:hypothetical protein